MQKEKLDTGPLGEAIAAKYLTNHGFTVIERNFKLSFGELDLVARNGDIIHFVEVKTVSHETKEFLQLATEKPMWRPEELIHDHKLHKLQQITEGWCISNNYSGDIQLDGIAVRLVKSSKYATVAYFPNIFSA